MARDDDARITPAKWVNNRRQYDVAVRCAKDFYSIVKELGELPPHLRLRYEAAASSLAQLTGATRSATARWASSSACALAVDNDSSLPPLGVSCNDPGMRVTLT